MSFDSTIDDLADPAKRITSEQLTSLSSLDESERRRLAELWPQLEDSRRLNVITAMSDIAQDNVELNFDAVYKLALTDADYEVRGAGLRGLFEYEGRDLIRTLINLLREDEDPGVRREAAIALGRYAMAGELGHLGDSDTDDVREALIESVEDEMEDEVVRASAIEAVGVLSGEDTENLIESIFREESMWLKVGAVDAMGRSANEVWLPTVIDELASEAPEMRHAAAFAAGEIGAEDAIQPLRKLAITDPDREVQLAAIRGLGEIGGATAVVALKSILYEGDDDLREAVEEAISEAEFYDDPLNPTR
jgi:HEAT repeat protein